MIVKYRLNVFDDEEIVDELKSPTKNISDNYDVDITNQEKDKDQISFCDVSGSSVVET